MKNAIILGVAGALGTGIMCGIQATLSTRTGELIGSTRTSLFTNVVGGTLAALVVLVLVMRPGQGPWQVPKPAVIMLITSGALGILIVTGVSLSLQHAGVTAGLAAIILGQLIVSVIIDAVGWGGAEPIPLSWQRVAGLAGMAVGVYLLLGRD